MTQLDKTITLLYEKLMGKGGTIKTAAWDNSPTIAKYNHKLVRGRNLLPINICQISSLWLKVQCKQKMHESDSDIQEEKTR